MSVDFGILGNKNSTVGVKPNHSSWRKGKSPYLLAEFAGKVWEDCEGGELGLRDQVFK